MKQHNHNYNGYVRIIGGQWRGKKLPVLNITELRPTTNRMRETLFNWLACSIINARCLDCFAGSGALGLEALSRYAASSTLLEVKFVIAQQLKKNIFNLKAFNAKIINVNTLTFLAYPSSIPYDIVFVDPPFHKKLLLKTLTLLEKNGWLANNSFVYVESETDNYIPLISTNWELYRKKTIGMIFYRLYRFKA